MSISFSRFKKKKILFKNIFLEKFYKILKNFIFYLFYIKQYKKFQRDSYQKLLFYYQIYVITYVFLIFF